MADVRQMMVAATYYLISINENKGIAFGRKNDKRQSPYFCIYPFFCILVIVQSPASLLRILFWICRISSGMSSDFICKWTSMVPAFFAAV